MLSRAFSQGLSLQQPKSVSSSPSPPSPGVPSHPESCPGNAGQEDPCASVQRYLSPIISPSNAEPWVSSLSTSEILATIPENEADNPSFVEDAKCTEKGAARLKALPIKTGLSTKDELARIPASLTSDLQGQHGRYVHKPPSRSDFEIRPSGVQQPVTHPLFTVWN